MPDLEPDTTYQFRVAYRNERGLGAYSPVLQAKTLKFWVPSPPKAPTLEIIDGVDVKVSFDMQYHDHCLEYEVQYSKDKCSAGRLAARARNRPSRQWSEEFQYYFSCQGQKQAWVEPWWRISHWKNYIQQDKAQRATHGARFIKHTPTTVTLECKKSSLSRRTGICRFGSTVMVSVKIVAGSIIVVHNILFEQQSQGVHVGKQRPRQHHVPSRVYHGQVLQGCLEKVPTKRQQGARKNQRIATSKIILCTGAFTEYLQAMVQVL